MDNSPSLDSLTRRSSDQVPVRHVPAWVIPLVIIAGFALLFLGLFRDRLWPAPDVDVAIVLATLSDSPGASGSAGKGASGEMLFQASGWIEPDPLDRKSVV